MSTNEALNPNGIELTVLPGAGDGSSRRPSTLKRRRSITLAKLKLADRKSWQPHMKELGERELALLKEDADLNKFRLARRCCYLATVGVACFIASNEVQFAYRQAPPYECIYDTPISPEAWWVVTILQFALTLSTVALVVSNIQYHRAKLDELILSKDFSSDCSLAHRHVLGWVIVDCLLCALHCPPMIESCWSTGSYTPEDKAIYPMSLLSLFTLCRVYLLYRYVRLLNRVNSTTGRIVARMFHLRRSPVMALKDAVQNHPFEVIGVSYLCSLLAAGFAIMCFERPIDHVGFRELNDPNFLPTYTNTVWCAWSVMTTVGLGDWYPLTPAGRLTAVVANLCGMLLSGVLLGSISSRLEYSPIESQVCNTYERLALSQSIPHHAATLIKLWWKRIHAKWERAPNYHSLSSRFCVHQLKWKAMRHETDDARARDLVAVGIIPPLLDMQGMLGELASELDVVRNAQKEVRNVVMSTPVSPVNMQQVDISAKLIGDTGELQADKASLSIVSRRGTSADGPATGIVEGTSTREETRQSKREPSRSPKPTPTPRIQRRVVTAPPPRMDMNVNVVVTAETQTAPVPAEVGISESSSPLVPRGLQQRQDMPGVLVGDGDRGELNEECQSTLRNAIHIRATLRQLCIAHGVPLPPLS